MCKMGIVLPLALRCFMSVSVQPSVLKYLEDLSWKCKLVLF